MTPTEITTHALALGITPELYPEFWRCTHCQRSCARCICGGTSGHVCTLPDPDSDDPTACLWEPFLMRALPNGFYLRQATWAGEVAPNGWVVLGPSWFYEDAQEVIGTGATPTAALYAAWLAKEKP